jgi:hypothetical protein
MTGAKGDNFGEGHVPIFAKRQVQKKATGAPKNGTPVKGERQ